MGNRWTIKLTGLGLKHFKSSPTAEVANFGSLLWTAPEHIRDQNIQNIDQLQHPDVANDIYALGVILSEFCTRDLPYSEVMLEKEDMISLICGKGDTTDARKVWDDFLTEHNLEVGSHARPLIREH